MVGIETLIVFIAMVLIATVAASVLITTSENLQSRAKTVGTATIREVSAGLAIEDIAGYTNAAANPRNTARMVSENIRKIRDLRVKKMSIVNTTAALFGGITFGIAFSVYTSLVIATASQHHYA